MLVPFLIMLREGVEAALIVGIVASYLQQTGRSAWMRGVWGGVLAAVALSLAVGIALYLASAEFPQRAQEAFEAAVGLVAVGILTSMVFWMRKAGRSIKATLQASVDAAFAEDYTQGLPLVGVVFFAVAREGLESVFFLLATFEQNVGLGAPVGALSGLLAAAAIGYALYRGGARLPLKQFFHWTGIFILFVAAGLLAGSLRALHEAGVWNAFQETAFDLSAILPSDGILGSVLAGVFGYQDAPTVGEVGIYLAYLAPALVFMTFGFPGRTLRLATINLAAIALMVVAGAGVYFIARAASPTQEDGASGAAPAQVAVNVTASACEPNDLTAPAGRVTFSIHNASARALEWEILDGVMVVAERENIAPNFIQNLTAKLEPGEYAITCGLLSNPKGSLHVVGRAGASAKPSQVDLIGPLAEYRVYASYEIDGLVDEARRLAEALKSGDLDSARASFSAAHAHYARIAPIAVFFPDLDGSVETGKKDGDAAKDAMDPDLAGFRQLEWDLFASGERRDFGPLADKIVADAVALQTRFENLPLTPAPTIAGATEAIGGITLDGIGGDADRRGGVHLSDIQANVEGVRKIVDLFHPLIAKADSPLGRALDDDFAAFDATLAKYKNADGAFTLNARLSDDDRIAVQNAMKKLTGELSRVAAALGLS